MTNGDAVSEVTPISAITLPDTERAVIGQLFAAAGLDPEQWQRDALAAKVEELKLAAAQTEAQQIVAAAQAELREQVPSLFEQ
jgi:hypothetical protein